MKKQNISFEPTHNTLVGFSDNFNITKGTELRVPNGFIAGLVIDNRIVTLFRESVVDLVSVDNHFKGKNAFVAFFKKGKVDGVWGVGDIHINLSGKGYAYIVGVNGTYDFEIAPDGYSKVLLRRQNRIEIPMNEYSDIILGSITPIVRTIVKLCLNEKVERPDAENYIEDMTNALADISSDRLFEYGILISKMHVNQVYAPRDKEYALII